MPSQSPSRIASQTAAALGVTPKTLRVWEAHGLLRPARSAAGWRIYGPAEFARIHQVLALRGLGLGLAEIAGLLAGRLADLDAVLALQAEVLRRRRAEADKGLALIASARARLKSGEPFSLDDFANLIRETTMTQQPDTSVWREVIAPIAEKHYTPQELELVLQKKTEAIRRWNSDGAAIAKAWDDLIAEAKAVCAKGDPTSSEAMDLARRWNELAHQFVPDVGEISAKARAVWQEAMQDPASAARLPVGPELLAFMRAAAEAHRARPPA